MSKHPMVIRVQLFGSFRDVLDAGHIDVTMPEQATFADLRAEIVRLYPRLGARIGRFPFAVGDGFVRDPAPLRDGMEVTIIGLVGGG